MLIDSCDSLQQARGIGEECGIIGGIAVLCVHNHFNLEKAGHVASSLEQDMLFLKEGFIKVLVGFTEAMENRVPAFVYWNPCRVFSG